MKLFYEGSLHATYEMADGLLNSYSILEESEWMDHFSDVIGSFCEIFDLSDWGINFTCYTEVKALRNILRKANLRSQGEIYILQLVNSVIQILKEER